MHIWKRRLVPAIMVTMVLVVTITGTASAFFFIRHHNGLTVTIHQSNITPTPVASRSAPIKRPLPEGQDWTQYRFDVTGTGMNPEGSISTQNVGQLVQQWAVRPKGEFGSTPAVVNGIVYATNGNDLSAVDLDTGKTLWLFEGVSQSYGIVTSSVAVDPATHLAYYGTPDARVYAINTLSGKEVWDAQIGAPEKGAYIWSSPLVVHGNVYIGLASHDDKPCVRGGVFAFNALTGKVVWTHYMTRNGTLGGGVWSSLIAVPSEHEIVATTGNPCPEGRSDDDEDGVLAMNWDSGTTLWQYTALSYDDCDCDFGEGAVDYVYHGQEYLVAGNKAGDIYALAPLKGNHSVRLAWKLKISMPGYLGLGGIFQPPTYSNGLVFVAGGPTPDGTCKGGKLFALQADIGAVQWSTCTRGQVVSPSSTTGEVLFVEQQGTLVAYEAATGGELWRVEQQPGLYWGGVSLSRGSVLVASVDGVLYCYRFAKVPKPRSS